MHSRGTLRDPPLPIPSCRWVAGVCCSHFLFSSLSCYFARTSSLREQLASHWWCYHTISKLCAQPMLCGAPARVSRRDLRRTEKEREDVKDSRRVERRCSACRGDFIFPFLSTETSSADRGFRPTLRRKRVCSWSSPDFVVDIL